MTEGLVLEPFQYRFVSDREEGPPGGCHYKEDQADDGISAGWT